MSPLPERDLLLDNVFPEFHGCSFLGIVIVVLGQGDEDGLRCVGKVSITLDCANNVQALNGVGAKHLQT